MPRSRSLLAVITAVALPLAACGDGDEPARQPAPSEQAAAQQTAEPEMPDQATPAVSRAEPQAKPPDSAAEATQAEPTAQAQEQAEPSAAGEPGPEPVDLSSLEIESFPLPPGSRPHDVAPAADGGVWYTAQNRGVLGWLDPASGEVREIPLGDGSRPHGVIVGAGGDAWITDSGLNAIVHVAAETDAVSVYPLPPDRPNANLNTASFDGDGILWFTGQSGIVGRFDPATEAMTVSGAPRGRGPYGIATTPASEAKITVLEPPTPNQGTRRVWADSQGNVWSSQWTAGRVARYVPATGEWTEWPLPGAAPQAYAVYVDARDIVWVSDFGGDAIHAFDPASEEFTTFPLPHAGGNVRQILGRPGEVWAPESGADSIFVIR